MDIIMITVMVQHHSTKLLFVGIAKIVWWVDSLNGHNALHILCDSLYLT